MTETIAPAVVIPSHVGYLSNPRPLGAAAPTSSYLHDHPMIEVGTEAQEGEDYPAILADNGQDLYATIGKRTVRYHAYAAQGARAAEMVRRIPGTRAGSTVDGNRHGLACFVCGTQYEPQSNASRLGDLDNMTAPWGGREACGPALASWGEVRNPDVWLSVTLPASVSQMLTTDGTERRVHFVAAAHNDSSAVDRWYVVVSGPDFGGAILLRGTSLDLRGRHTRSGLALSKERLERLAAELPAKIAEHADMLRRMAATALTIDDVLRMALVVCNDGSDEAGDLSERQTETLWNDALRFVSRVVSSRNVEIDGGYRASAVFEAAASRERSGLVWTRRLQRLVDGQAPSDIALRVITPLCAATEIPAVPAPTTVAAYAPRFDAATTLPALDKLPGDVVLPGGENVAALRLTWCTALAADGIDADDRVERLRSITDPLAVLAIIAPHVEVRRVTLAPRPVVVPFPVNDGDMDRRTPGPLMNEDEITLDEIERNAAQ